MACLFQAVVPACAAVASVWDLPRPPLGLSRGAASRGLALRCAACEGPFQTDRQGSLPSVNTFFQKQRFSLRAPCLPEAPGRYLGTSMVVALVVLLVSWAGTGDAAQAPAVPGTSPPPKK